MQNFDQTLNAFKNRQPFQPFTVVMADGDCFKADFPNALVGRDGMAVYLQEAPQFSSIMRASAKSSGAWRGQTET